jgi:hypothetical protein
MEPPCGRRQKTEDRRCRSGFFNNNSMNGPLGTKVPAYEEEAFS